MISFKGIDEKLNLDKKEREGLQEQLKGLLREMTDAEQAMQAAAESGDLPGFNAAKEKRDSVENAVFVAKSKLAAPRSHEVRKAVFDRWDEYAAKYNRDFTARKAKYLKHREELCREYLGLVELQNTALQDKGIFDSFAAENNIDLSGWNPNDLEYLERNAPEIDFITRAERPEIEYGLLEVVKARSHSNDLTGSALDTRLKCFLKFGKTI